MLRVHPRSARALAAAVAAALVSLLAAAAAAAAADPPPAGASFGLPAPGAGRGFNLLLITLDTTRADHLGCYGDRSALTPNLDRLAAAGLRFTQAITTAPQTLPAHATILTGEDPPRHGVRMNAEDRLDDRAVTLAEALAGAGYDTGAFVSSFVLDRRFGLGQGFAVYDDRVETTAGGGFSSGENERRAEATIDDAIAWIGAKRERPFFAWVHLYDAHAPYAPPAPFAARFAAHPYDGEIAYVDSELGRLFAYLDVKRLTARSVIVVVGDHGESLGEHGETTHSIFVYDAVTRVPLIVANPALLPAPRVVDDAVVSTADLTPTLLDLLGVADGATRDGVDWLRTPPDPQRAVYVESLVSYRDFGWAPLYALRTRTRKYVLAPRDELYDLTADPGELHDLLAAQPPADDEVGRRLRAELRRRVVADASASLASAPSGGTAADAEARARIAALGYVGGAGPVAGGQLADPKDRIAIPNALIEANAETLAGRPEKARAILVGIKDRAKGDRSLLQALAKVDVRLGRLAEAEAALRAFRAIRPKADTSLLLAQILILDGRLDEAGALLDEAERLEPDHGGVAIARGDLLLRQGQRDAARRAYERAREIDPYRAAGAAAARVAQLDAGAAPKP
jgi:choline-sulfatase